MFCQRQSIRSPLYHTYKMVVVAVAGGTGGVGRTVLDAIAQSGEHIAIVLSRTVSASSTMDPTQ